MSLNLANITLTLTDLTNGSATCKAQLASAVSGVLVTVYASAWTPQPNAKSWSVVGSGTTDGTGAVTLTLSPGFGWWNFVATTSPTGFSAYADSISSDYFFPLPNPNAVSIWESCADAVVLLIQSMNLSGIGTANVIKQRWAKAVRNPLPSIPLIMVCPYDKEEIPNVLNMADDIVYPVVVIFADAANRDSNLNMTRDMVWRAKVSSSFRFQRLNGVPTVVNCLLRPLALAAADTLNMGNVSAGGLRFDFVSRENRGLS